MKRAAALTALFITGLLLALTLAGGGLGWYSTSTQTHTYPTETTETTQTTDTALTETVLCPNGNPNTGGKDGHPGNDSCAPDETTPPETTSTSPPPPGTTEETTTQETTTEATTESTETETTTSTPPPLTPPVKPPKPPKPHRPHHPKPPPICKPGKVEMGECAPQGSG